MSDRTKFGWHFAAFAAYGLCVIAANAAVLRSMFVLSRQDATASHILLIPVVTLVGNGPLLAANVGEAKDLPPRVLLDFHGVAAGSACHAGAVRRPGSSGARPAHKMSIRTVTTGIAEVR